MSALSAAMATTAGCGVFGGSSNSTGTAAPASAGRTVGSAAAGASVGPSGAAGAASGAGTGGAAASADAAPGQAAAGLSRCLVGSWHASASREFTQLGMTARSKGAISSASGTLRMRFTADHGFTFSYDDVKLALGTGEARVNGPITGTWALVGNVLTATAKKSSVRIAVTVAGMSVDPSGSFDSLLQSVTPRGAATTCAGNVLSMKVPTDPAKKVISTVTFDRG